MNKYRIGKLLLLPLLLGTFGACSDFDAVPLEYKEDPAFDVDPAWELELLGGQPDDRVVVYKDKNTINYLPVLWDGMAVMEY